MFKTYLTLELSLRLVELQCNIQLDPTEQGDGKLACNVWRGVPISDHAIIKFQPALPPLQSGPPQLPKLATEQAADAVWAAEGYLQVLPLLLTLIEQFILRLVQFLCKVRICFCLSCLDWQQGKLLMQSGLSAGAASAAGFICWSPIWILRCLYPSSSMSLQNAELACPSCLNWLLNKLQLQSGQLRGTCRCCLCCCYSTALLS